MALDRGLRGALILGYFEVDWAGQRVRLISAPCTVRSRYLAPDSV